MAVETHRRLGVREAAPPASAPEAPRRLARADLMLLAFLGVVATGLQLLRQPGVPSWDSVWQEDGAIFLTDALANPFLETLVTPYNAYLHTLPRLIAGPVALVGLEHAALLMTFLSALTVTLIAMYVYFASARVFHTQWARVVLAMSVVLLPAAGYETNANIANLHWYLIFACFWVFVAAPRTTAGIAVGITIVALAVLSDPLAALLAPLPLIALWRDRTWRGRAIPLVFLGTLAVQLVLGVVEDPVAPYASSHLPAVPKIYALRVTGSFLVGDLFLDNFWKPWGLAFALAALLVVAAVCAYGLLRADRGRRLLIGGSLALSVGYLTVPLMLRGTENFLDRGDFSLNGSRYVLLPILFLTIAVLLTLDRRDPRLSSRAWRNVQIGFSALTAALVLTNFSIFTVRSGGPAWKESVASARERCATVGGRRPGSPPKVGSIPIRRLPAGDVRIPIAPNVRITLETPYSPFAVTVDCRHLR